MSISQIARNEKNVKTPRTQDGNIQRTPLADQVNNLVSEFKERTSSLNVPLGQAYSNFKYDDAAAHLQLSRLHKKFEVLDTEYDPVRRERTIKKVIAYEETGLRKFNPSKLDATTKNVLYNARKTLHDALRLHYRPSPDDVCLPSGESAVSANGDVSAYAKLKNAKYWTTTRRNFDSFARTVYNHPGLKHAAKRHFRYYESKKQLVAPGVYAWRKFDNNAMWLALSDEKPQKRAFLIFKAKLRCIVTFQEECRITTVPKDNEDDRVIICANFCNMIQQLKIHNATWRMIKDAFDVKLEDSQLLHKLMLLDPNNATVDFSNASNSVYLSVCEWFFSGTSLWRDIINAREDVVRLPGNEYHQFIMLSPMGNGFTFVVMTLLILSIARELDSFAHVFGDDLVVDSTVVDTCVSILSAIGFKTNVKKTFTEGNFRESCGGFTCEGKYITSYDFHCNDTDMDAVITVNKVGIIANSTPTKFTQLWHRLHNDLLELIPVHLLRGYNFSEDHAANTIRRAMHDVQAARRRPNTLTWSNRLYEDLTDAFMFPSEPGLNEGVFTNPRRVRRLQAKDPKVQKKMIELGRTHNHDACSYTLVKTQENKVYTRTSVVNGKRKTLPWIPLDNTPPLLGLCWIGEGKSSPVKLRDTYEVSTWQRLPVLR